MTYCASDVRAGCRETNPASWITREGGDALGYARRLRSDPLVVPPGQNLVAMLVIMLPGVGELERVDRVEVAHIQAQPSVRIEHPSCLLIQRVPLVLLVFLVVHRGPIVRLDDFSPRQLVRSLQILFVPIGDMPDQVLDREV